MTTIKLPGLVDTHVHLREPGAIHKEDFDSGTRAALAGGFTYVAAMPNTSPSVTDAATLGLARAAARAKAHCDFGLYLGATVDNVSSAADLANDCAGLKMYLDNTFGTLKMDSLGALLAHARAWPAERPLLCHAEQRTAAAAIMAAHLAGRSIHICHVSRIDELELIRRAKQAGIAVTCEVCPHHLWLCDEDIPRLGAGRAEVRPMLATRADMLALRANLDLIDMFATDHAPHLLTEKDSPAAPPGYPGLETALPLYLRLVEEGLLSLDGVIARMSANPRRIYALPEQPETWIEVDLDAVWTARGAQMQTRAGWTPFEGWPMKGRVERVVLRGREAYAQGRVTVEPGYGREIGLGRA